MLPVYNVLLLGPTQSGKSTFLENVKQYANPCYNINTTRIGKGNVSHTQTSFVEDVVTALPIYKVYGENGVEFDTRSIKDEMSLKRFLTRDDDFELRPVEVPGSPQVRFRIFDTPGLNDTNDNDIQNIASTFSTLSEVGHLNLIIMDSHHVPLTLSQKDAFKTYFDLFRDLAGLITVVHTHSPNKCRPGMNKSHDEKLKERSEFFNQIMGREVPTKRIDCDPYETGPANLCMTRNAIREILEMAKVKAAVTLNTTRVCKTWVMSGQDRVACQKYEIKLGEYLEKCQNESQKVTVEIEKIRGEIENKQDDILQHDTDELLLLFEKRFDEQVDFLGFFQDAVGRSSHTHTMGLLDQEYTIDEIHVAQEGIHVLKELGGRGHTSWNVMFRRYIFNTGYYHAVLKTKKSTRFRAHIEKWKSEVDHLNKDLEIMKQNLSTLEGQDANDSSDGSSSEFVELRNAISKCRRILDITTAPTLPLNLFMELAKAGVYQRYDPVRDPDIMKRHHDVLEQYVEKTAGHDEVVVVRRYPERTKNTVWDRVQMGFAAVYVGLFWLAIVFGGAKIYLTLAFCMLHHFLRS